MKVKDIMQTKLTKVSPDMTVEDVAKTMVNEKVGSVLIEKDHEVVGIVTQGDIVVKVIAKEKNPSEVFANEIKTMPMIMIDQEADMLDAVDLLNEYKIRRIVVANNGEVVGIISSKVIGAKMRKLISDK